MSAVPICSGPFLNSGLKNGEIRLRPFDFGHFVRDGLFDKVDQKMQIDIYQFPRHLNETTCTMSKNDLWNAHLPWKDHNDECSC